MWPFLKTETKCLVSPGDCSQNKQRTVLFQ